MTAQDVGGHVYKIPARLAYEAMVDDPAYSGNTTRIFDASVFEDAVEKGGSGAAIDSKIRIRMKGALGPQPTTEARTAQANDQQEGDRGFTDGPRLDARGGNHDPRRRILDKFANPKDCPASLDVRRAPPAMVVRMISTSPSGAT
jgi:hypothetical protein